MGDQQQPQEAGQNNTQNSSVPATATPTVPTMGAGAAGGGGGGGHSQLQAQLQQQIQNQPTHIQVTQQAPPQSPALQPMTPTQQSMSQTPPSLTPTPQPSTPTTPQMAHQVHPQAANIPAAAAAAAAAAAQAVPQGQIRTSLPQVQVIHQPMQHPSYLQQLYNQHQQQQIMFQNAAVAAMQAGGLNPQMNLAVQGRPPSVGPKSPGLIAPVPPTQGVSLKSPVSSGAVSVPSASQALTSQALMNKSNAMGGSNLQSKPNSISMGAPQQLPPGATAVSFGGNKQMIQQQGVQPMVIGQLGVFPTQPTSSHTVVMGRPNASVAAVAPTSQQQGAPKPHEMGDPKVHFSGPQGPILCYRGVIPNQPVTCVSTNGIAVGQPPKSPSVFSMASMGPQHQIIGNPQQQIRLSTQPTLVTNTGQILGQQPTMITNQTVINHLQAMATLQQSIPIAHQSVLASQSPTLLGNQPVYIRAAGPIQSPQQQPQGMLGNMQAIRQNKPTMELQPNLAQVRPGNMVPQKVKMSAQTQTSKIPPLGAQPGSPRFSNPVGIQQVSRMDKTAQVQPTNLTVQATNNKRMPLQPPQQARQVSKVKATTQSKPSSPVPPMITQSKGTVTNGSQANGGQTAHPKPETPVNNQSAPPILIPIPPKLQKLQQQQSSEDPKDGVTPVDSEPPQLEAENVDIKTENKAETPPPQLIKINGTVESPEIVTNNNGHNVELMDIPPEREAPKEAEPQTNGQMERQRAIVKPQVLTHVIEGFVIQEAPDPFPVQRSSLLTEFIMPKPIQPRPVEQASQVKEPQVKAVQQQSRLDSQGRVGRGLHLYHRHYTNRGLTRAKSLTRPSHGRPRSQDPTAVRKCEFCGKVDFSHKFRRSKRFCSMACAKRYNVGCSRRMGLFMSKVGRGGRYIPKSKRERELRRGQELAQLQAHALPEMQDEASQEVDEEMQEVPQEGATDQQQEQQQQDQQQQTSPTSASVQRQMSDASVATASPEEEDESQSSSQSDQDQSSSPVSPPSPQQPEMEVDIHPPTHPSKWTVQEVYDFIKSMPGCTSYADEFRTQEIDGQALMLLKEDHLMSAMNMKLGPALKICARINSLKEEMGGTD